MGRIGVAWFILSEQQAHEGQMRKKAGNEVMVRSEEFAALLSGPTHHSLYSVHEPRRA